MEAVLLDVFSFNPSLQLNETSTNHQQKALSLIKVAGHNSGESSKSSLDKRALGRVTYLCHHYRCYLIKLNDKLKKSTDLKQTKIKLDKLRQKLYHPNSEPVSE